jgi:fumarate reductase subunit D
LSGLALAIFLPLHFWALGQALQGAAALDGFLRFADQGLVKFAEWGLVILLALHMAGGIRLLLIEFGNVSGLRKNWIAGTMGFAVVAGMVFALSLFH